ncbi:MAG: HAD family hydrolase [Candidatus Methylacidiphilales bacterium]|nr:HAD family phosphatase [Candidatus Methylacidiphilales bacterium]
MHATQVPKIKAAIFDMDGLMLDTEMLFKRGWMHALKLHGQAMGDDIFVRMIGRTAVDSERMLLAEYGPDFPLLDVRVDCEKWIRAYVGEHGVPKKPGIVELLEHLKRAGIPLAVATSTARFHAEPRLMLAGLWPYFQASVCGDEVSAGKPNPEIFLRAAEKLGMPPQHCVILEDSLAGITGAHAAGAIPIMIPDLVSPTPEVAALTHRIFPSLVEARTYLAGL